MIYIWIRLVSQIYTGGPFHHPIRVCHITLYKNLVNHPWCTYYYSLDNSAYLHNEKNNNNSAYLCFCLNLMYLSVLSMHLFLQPHKKLNQANCKTKLSSRHTNREYYHCTPFSFLTLTSFLLSARWSLRKLKPLEVDFVSGFCDWAICFSLYFRSRK